MSNDSDNALLAVLEGVDALLSRHGVSARDLREALREAAVEGQTIGISEAASLLGTHPSTLRRAVAEGTYSPELPAPLWVRSNRGPLWLRSQMTLAVSQDPLKRAPRKHRDTGEIRKRKPPEPWVPPENMVTTDWGAVA